MISVTPGTLHLMRTAELVELDQSDQFYHAHSALHVLNAKDTSTVEQYRCLLPWMKVGPVADCW